MRSKTSIVLLVIMACLVMWSVFACPQAAQAQSIRRGVSRQRTPAFSLTASMPPEEIGHIGHLDYVNGFRGIKFGTQLSELNGFKLMKDLGPLKVYTREQESLNVGNGEASSIVYRFLNGKFMDAGIFASGDDNATALRQLIEAAYGSGLHAESSPSVFYWRGQKANGRLAVHTQTGAMEFWLGSNAMQEEYVRYLKERIRNAARSL